MVVLVTCKNEEDPIENECARVVTTLSINFKMLKKGANSIIGDWNLTRFKLIQDFIVVFLIFTNKENPFKMKALEWSKHFSHYKSIEIFQMFKGS